MVIAITGIVITVVAVFIAPATTSYFASSARAQLGDQADTALRRIARDLALALPNSARISSSGKSLELIPVSGAARYAVESNPPAYGITASPFNVVGPALKLSHASQQLAWYNLGPSVPDADAYTLSNVRTATSAAGNATSVSFTGTTPLPASMIAAPYRVYAIEPPVTYRCDTSTTPGTLTRYTGYGFQSSQPEQPSGGSAAVLARDVTGCQFDASTGVVAARYGLVTLQITLSRNGESVSLYHAVHVDNLP